MPGERATVLQKSQIGPEVTPGVAVAAPTVLGATSITINSEGAVDMFGPQGQKFDTIAALGKEWCSLAISGKGSYADMAHLFSGLIKKVTPAQQASSAAYLWTFTPSSSAEDVVQTYTVEQGSLTRAGRAAYGLIGELGLEWSRDGIGVSGSGIAQRYEDDVPMSTSAAYTLTAAGTPPTAGNYTLTYLGQTTAVIAWNATPAVVKAALEVLTTIGVGNIDVTATVATGAGNLSVAANVYKVSFKRALSGAPQTLTGTFTTLTPSASIALGSSVTGAPSTLLSPVPILGNQVSVYMDAASGGLGTTKLLRAFKGSWKYGGRFGPVWPVDAALPSFAAHVELKPAATFSFSLAADDVGMGLLSTLRAGDTKFIRWEAVGPIIASTYAYRLRIDMALKISNVLKFEDADGIYQVGVEGTIVYDSGWGKSFEASVQSAQVTL